MTHPRGMLTDESVTAFNGDPKYVQALFWDTEVKGFGLRRAAKSGVKTFLLTYRDLNNKLVTLKLGRFGEITTAQARAKAREIKTGLTDSRLTQRVQATTTNPDLLSKALLLYAQHLERQETKQDNETAANELMQRRHFTLEIASIILDALEYTEKQA